MQPTLILVAGGPGAGKTTFGRALAKRLASSVLLDKDVLASPWVDAMLARLNDGQVDRDSEVYWNDVRPLEYEALLAVALDNLALGKSVVAVAPFGPELRDMAWRDACTRRVGQCDAALRIVWLATDAATARERMSARGDARDQWKLAHWDEFAGVERFAAPAAGLVVLDNVAGVDINRLVTNAIDSLELR